MRKMTRTLTSVSLGIVLVFAAITAAHADLTSTTTYDVPVSLTQVPWSNDFSVSQFNPSLGTLESVTLIFSGGIGGTTTITDNNSTNLVVPYKWYVSDTITLTDAAGALSPLTITTPTSGSSEFSATLTSQQTSSTESITGSGSLSPISDAVSPYIGTGVLELAVSAPSFTSTVTSGSNSTVNFPSSTADASLEVTYDYTPVPLPPSLLAFVPGLVGLAAMRRRFKK